MLLKSQGFVVATNPNGEIKLFFNEAPFPFPGQELRRPFSPSVGVRFYPSSEALFR